MKQYSAYMEKQTTQEELDPKVSRWKLSRWFSAVIDVIRRVVQGGRRTLEIMRESMLRYGSALAASIPLLPVFAAAAFLLAAIAPSVSLGALHFGSPLLTGSFIALLAWLIIGVYYLQYVLPETATRMSYSTLKNRLNGVNALISQLPDAPTDDATAWKVSLEEAKQHRDTVCCMLKTKGMSWAQSTGYINAWVAVHSAEEALLRVMPRALVLQEMASDQLRLTGSAIANQAELLKRLGQAQGTLTQQGCTHEAEGEARAALCTVRRAINEFRDGSWSGMVRAKNRLVMAMMATALLADLVIALAVIGQAPTGALLAATTFFFVGAGAGCLLVLNNWSMLTGSVEDYGLASTQFLIRPLYSGLAGVAGVVLIAMLSPVVTTTVSGSQSTVAVTATALPTVAQPLTPVPGQTGPPRLGGGNPRATGTAQTANPPNAVNTPGLGEIFDLSRHPFSLLLATIFGLTPSLLINRLLQQTQQYQTNVKTSEAADQANPPAGPGTR